MAFRCLKQERRIKGLSTVTTVHGEVTAAGQEVLVSDTPNHQSNTTITERGVPASGRTSLGIERIDLLTSNIEGGERAGLYGMQRATAYGRHGHRGSVDVAQPQNRQSPLLATPRMSRAGSGHSEDPSSDNHAQAHALPFRSPALLPVFYG